MSNHKQPLPIYVLNVKKFTARREFMQQQLDKEHLSAEFILDGDIEDLSAELQSQYFYGDQTSMGQRSCAMKHIYTLQKIAASGDGFSLVLEDDAVFGADFQLGIERALSQSHLFPGPKVIYIGSGGNHFTPKSKRKAGQYLYLGHRNRFTDSYMIDADTARKRLEWIAQHKIGLPIDNQFEKMDAELGIQNVWLEDPVVEQGSKNGLFQSALEDAPPQWLQAIKFGWEKLRRKKIYQLWK